MDNLARPRQQGNFSETFAQCVRSDGSLPVVGELESFLAECRDPTALRSVGKTARAALLADIAHFMCVSHGRHPGIVDHAATKIADVEAREWLLRSTEAFINERSFLTKLTVAAGPIHGHSGHENLSALLSAQSNSFEMLGTSDRHGCPAGAAIAFIVDWQSTRPVLEGLALLLGVEPAESKLPTVDESIDLVETLSGDNRIERAMRFGAEQLLAQQRGLWKIIAARHQEMMDFG